MKKQLFAHFKGHVQGVGFRFTTKSIAARFDVEGYVKNLSDGSVELLAQGEEKELRAFLQEIRTSQLSEYITAMNMDWLEPGGSYAGFNVKY